MKKKVDGNFTLSVKEIPEVFPSWWWMGSAGARLSIRRGRPAWEQLSMRRERPPRAGARMRISPILTAHNGYWSCLNPSFWACPTSEL